jgi:hypothetical protein
MMEVIKKAQQQALLLRKKLVAGLELQEADKVAAVPSGRPLGRVEGIDYEAEAMRAESCATPVLRPIPPPGMWIMLDKMAEGLALPPGTTRTSLSSCAAEARSPSMLQLKSSRTIPITPPTVTANLTSIEDPAVVSQSAKRSREAKAKVPALEVSCLNASEVAVTAASGPSVRDDHSPGNHEYDGLKAEKEDSVTKINPMNTSRPVKWKYLGRGASSDRAISPEDNVKRCQPQTPSLECLQAELGS